MSFDAKDLANTIYRGVLLNLPQDKLSVFLAGAILTDKSSIRYNLYKKLDKKGRLNIYFPEIIFTEIFNIRNMDFLSLENILVDSVHCTILCAESYGSIAELGAFANHELLRKRLIVILDKKYKGDESFINLGPVRLLRKENKSSIIWHDVANGDYEKLASEVYNKAKKFSEIENLNYSLKNPGISEGFILASLYCLKFASFSDLIKLVKKIETDDMEDILVMLRSTLTYLFNQRLVFGSEDIYRLTDEGHKKLKYILREKYKQMISLLDNVRIEVLNKQMRKKKIFL